MKIIKEITVVLIVVAMFSALLSFIMFPMLPHKVKHFIVNPEEIVLSIKAKLIRTKNWHHNATWRYLAVFNMVSSGGYAVTMGNPRSVTKTMGVKTDTYDKVLRNIKLRFKTEGDVNRYLDSADEENKRLGIKTFNPYDIPEEVKKELIEKSYKRRK